MDAREEPEFFIASKLHGIPLVTEAQNNPEANKEQSYNNINGRLHQNYATSVRPKRQFSELSSNMSGRQISVSVNGKPISNQMMHSSNSLPTRHPHESGGQTLREMVMKDLEKRQVDQAVSLLFKPSASTASVKNRHSGSATKPTTTTRKPKTITTTTRKITQNQVSRQQQSAPKSQQITRKLPTTTSTSTTTTSTTTSTTTTSTTTTKRPTLMPSTVKDKGFREDRASMFGQIKDEHASPLTTRQAPDYQQRTHQSLGAGRNQMSRFREEPSAGKNWILFNKGDGSFSTFEVAVLVSNVAIVGTIIFVILFTWIKAFNKKRESARSTKRQSDVESKTANADTVSSARFSDAFSGGGHPSAGNTPAPSRVSSIMSDVKPKSLTDEVGAGNKNNNTDKQMLSGANGNLPVRPASEASKLPSKAPPIVGAGARRDLSEQKSPGPTKSVDNDAKAISSIINGTRNANQSGSKAMAIVQPTENSTTAAADAEVTLTNQMMNSSMNDNQSSNVKSGAVVAANPSDSAGSTKPAENPTKKLDSTKKKSDRDQATDRIMSPNDSLQSIELPESLVQSIKRVEQSVQQPTNRPALKPSPNILLGEEVSQVEKQSQQPQHPMDTLNKFAKEVKDGAGKLITIEAQIEPKADLLREKIEPVNKPEPMNQNKETNNNNSKARPQNPTGRDSVNERGGMPKENAKNNDDKIQAINASNDNNNNHDSGIKNHQVVINKLDKRKTKLEIVDIRDESVTGKMGDQGKNNSANKDSKGGKCASDGDDLGQHWISMNGVAVTQGTPTTGVTQQTPNTNMTSTTTPMSGLNQALSESQIMSPSEIIGNRFSVDYRGSSSSAAGGSGAANNANTNKNDSIEDGSQNIDKEVEEDNQMKNRKYFVYIVHDGHFSAKKECIARIELPAKRKISLADVRQLIASSPDISLNSLRRNRFKFVTETYRLLNEDEDVANLHQVYPTQGVFLKLNVADQPESLSFPSQRGRPRMSSSSISNNLQYQQQQQLMSSSSAGKGVLNRQRRPLRSSTNTGDLPAIHVNDRTTNMAGQRPRGRSSGPQGHNNPRPAPGLGSRSKSGLDSKSLSNRNNNNYNNRNKNNQKASSSTALGRFIDEQIPMSGGSATRGANLDSSRATAATSSISPSSFGNDVISGARKLFNAIVA